MLTQKGFVPIIFIVGVLITSGLIVGGSFYIKNNHPELLNKAIPTKSSQQSTSQNISSDVASDKAYESNDSSIKYDLGNISKVLTCHIFKNPTYPENLSEIDRTCLGSEILPKNPNTNKSYYYELTNASKGYVLKAKLSTGEIYSVTEKTNPPDANSSKQKQLENYISQRDSVKRIEILGEPTDKITKLPPSIKNLKNLESLILSGNAICEIPLEIGELNLQWSLYLDGNCLKDLPPEIGKLTKVTGLNLSYNRFSELSSVIGKMTGLQNLWINHNDLITLPGEIGNLRVIMSIDASYNKLTSIPPEIGNLTNIRSLDFSYNQLTNLPDEISKLDNHQTDKRYSFERLNLEGNKFSDQEKQRIKQLLPTINITF